MSNIGDQIYGLCVSLWPINRSITGNGVRETLEIIQKDIPNLSIKEIPTGEQCFDWKVPREWNIRDAYILDSNDNKVIDFQNNNLHVLSYSTSVDEVMSLTELQKHLHSLPEQPNAIPYVTSYYEERWGFCLSENQRKSLKDGDYHVFIDSSLEVGSLTYGELIIPGRQDKEILLSTYICHPSLANNELSGPSVTSYLVKWLQSKNREYTYRVIFIPETIGSICYLSKNLDTMKNKVIAGFNITCVGDDNAYSYLPSRDGKTLSDRIALHTLHHSHPDFFQYSYLDRGSDERQYCSPGVDLPIATIMRTKYGEYDEYHTSLDNLEYISPEGLYGAYEMLVQCIEYIEENKVYKATKLCEPQMSRRNLYPTLGASKYLSPNIKTMMNILAYADGNLDLLSMAEKFNIPMREILESAKILEREGLLIELNMS